MLQPTVVTAIELQEHPLLGHPLSTTAMTGRTSAPRAGDARITKDRPDRRTGQPDPLPLRQQLGEVGLVQPFVSRLGELRDTHGADRT